MQNIILITQGLSRIVEPIVECGDYNVVGIVECKTRDKLNTKLGKGIKKICQLVLSYIYKKGLRAYSNRMNIPYFYMESSSKKLEDWVRNLNPDLIVVYSMSQLLSEKIFKIPKYGTINLHPSLLPEYRGPNPIFWQYYDYKSYFGVTVHFIDIGEDTGDIIYQKKIKIDFGIESSKLMNILINTHGVSMLKDAIDRMPNIMRIEQDKLSPTVRAKNVHNKAKDIINWDLWNTKRIWHFLRGTVTWLDSIEQPKGLFYGQRWIIGNYVYRNTDLYELGKIYKESSEKFIVCKDGIIYLKVKFRIKILLLKMFRNLF